VSAGTQFQGESLVGAQNTQGGKNLRFSTENNVYL